MENGCLHAINGDFQMITGKEGMRYVREATLPDPKNWQHNRVVTGRRGAFPALVPRRFQLPSGIGRASSSHSSVTLRYWARIKLS